MLAKLVLGVSALVFIAYGVLCLADPALPVSLAGLAIVNGDGYAEASAMYGGLQTGIGLFCLLATLRPSHMRSGLTLLMMAIGALALARLYAILTSEMAVTLYSWGALCYETLTAALSAIALQRIPSLSAGPLPAPKKPA